MPSMLAGLKASFQPAYRRVERGGLEATGSPDGASTRCFSSQSFTMPHTSAEFGGDR